MLELFLPRVIHSYKPKKLYLLKYPYAGIMSVENATKNGFYWIHVRGDARVLEERSTKFNLTKALAFFMIKTQSSAIPYFDYESKDLVQSLNKRDSHNPNKRTC